MIKRWQRNKIEYTRKWHEKNIQELNDTYIRTLIYGIAHRYGQNIIREEIPFELIKLKRTMIIALRAMKKWIDSLSVEEKRKRKNYLHHIYYHQNREDINKDRRIARMKNPQKYREQENISKIKHRDKVLLRQRKYFKNKIRDPISDSYVIDLIKKDLKFQIVISPELIEIKRSCIKAKRLFKQHD